MCMLGFPHTVHWSGKDVSMKLRRQAMLVSGGEGVIAGGLVIWQFIQSVFIYVHLGDQVYK